LQSFVPIFVENAQKLCEDLAVNVGKTKEFDVLTYTSHSALNMICGEFDVNFSHSLACSLHKKYVCKRRKMKTFVVAVSFLYAAHSLLFVFICSTKVKFINLNNSVVCKIQ
jgi:hypothetical protein